MKKMRKIALWLSLVLVGLVWVGESRAETVFCVNCSEMLTQQLDRITSLEQLSKVAGTYQEAMEQTRQQIALVQNNIQQLQNMIQNTVNLPANLLNQLKGQFGRLAKLTSQVKVEKGDYLALAQMFQALYPENDVLKDLAGSGDLDLGALWTKWTEESDRAAEATFQVTGSQLKDLTENAEALDRHISELLSTPEGQMQALQSGNSLAAIQIDELRQLRTLLATDIQGVVKARESDAKKAEASKILMDQIYEVEDFRVAQ